MRQKSRVFLMQVVLSVVCCGLWGQITAAQPIKIGFLLIQTRQVILQIIKGLLGDHHSFFKSV